MRAWEQEIQLIVQGRLKEAAEVYHRHRPDIGIPEALKIVAGVAKSMNTVVQTFEKVEVKKHAQNIRR